MGVRVECDLDALMAEALLNHFHGHSSLKEERRAGMSESVEGYSPDLRRFDKAGGRSGVEASLEMIDAFSRGTFPETIFYTATGENAKRYKSTWANTIAAAETYNDPGRFTAFIGYDCTSQVPPGNNLHRVVIYHDGAGKASQTVPYTTQFGGSTNPEDLWTALEAYEDKTGGELLAIAHNGNLSNGIMFPLINPVGDQPLTRTYAERRARWEPLYEATQIKGDGEAHPFLSPNDEFADFGTWDKGNLNAVEPMDATLIETELNEHDVKSLREALKASKKRRSS